MHFQFSWKIFQLAVLTSFTGPNALAKLFFSHRWPNKCVNCQTSKKVLVFPQWHHHCLILLRIYQSFLIFTFEKQNICKSFFLSITCRKIKQELQNQYFWKWDSILGLSWLFLGHIIPGQMAYRPFWPQNECRDKVKFQFPNNAAQLSSTKHQLAFPQANSASNNNRLSLPQHIQLQ